MGISTLIMEIIVLCRIVWSPLLAGLVLAGIAYLAIPKPYGIIVGAVLTLAAILVGIRMAMSFTKMQNEMNPDAGKINQDKK